MVPFLPDRAPIVVALFPGSEMRAAAFGYEVTEALEREMASSNRYDAVTPDRLRALLPSSLASAVVESQQLRNMENACPRFRQLASVAKVSLVLCGSVHTLSDGTFEISAT